MYQVPSLANKRHINNRHSRSTINDIKDSSIGNCISNLKIKYSGRTINTTSPFLKGISKDKIEFKNFIKRRIKYLNSLKSLPDNWISGESYKPNTTVIKKSKEFLIHLRNFLLQEKSSIPKILTNPISVGGIGFTIIANEDNKIYLKFLNDGDIELEIEENGYFSDKELTVDTNIDIAQEVNNELNEFQNRGKRVQR